MKIECVYCESEINGMEGCMLAMNGLVCPDCSVKVREEFNRRRREEEE